MIEFSKRRTWIVGAGSTLGLAAGLAAMGSARYAFAQPQRAPLVRTPLQTLGPFYPASEPPEQDNDLTRIAGGGIAKGDATRLSGTVFDTRGKPLRGVRVEIWQADGNGRYHHPLDTGSAPLDPNFQGFGAALTDERGGYSFRTIKPVPYTGRTPHIHFKLSGGGVPPFVTQLYIAGHPGNARDSLLAGVQDKRARDSLLALFVPIAGTDEWSAQWDIVVATDG